MSDRVIAALLTGWGAAAATALATGLVRADALGTLGPSWGLTFVATCAAGLWALWSRPANRAARRLLLFGCLALTWLAVSVELLVQVRAGAAGPGFVVVNLLAQTAGLAMVAGQVAALVRYPDGVARLGAERWVVVVLAGLAALLPVTLLLTRPDVLPTWVLQWSGSSDGTPVPAVASPWYLGGPDGLGAAAQLVDDAVLLVGTAVGVGILALRHRQLDTAGRRRVAWPLLATLLLVVGLVVNALGGAGAVPHLVGDGVSIACQVLLPVALAVGIVVPDLFDALGAVRRTVPYLVLSLLVLGGYVAAAGLLGVALGGPDLRVAVVVAVVGALALEPLRRTLVRRVRRLTHGPEVSRDELLLRLGDTLEHTMDRAALTRSIAETAMEGLGAQWVRLQPVDAPAVHVGRPARPGEHPALTAPLLHGHDELGVISCGPSDAGRSRARIKLQTLARQVAMALANARLADELNAQLTEVDASRQRLVTAEETARRRIERDLHDGAQQDLAALLTRIALARNQLGRADVARLDRTLATLQTDAGQALRNLRELVSGIHEATLADQGLVAAVESRAGKLPIPVEVVCGPGVRAGRLDATVESTAFFTVCEALANTLKHADADRVGVAMGLHDGSLRIDVADDGRGFDPSSTVGTGLTGLRDRIAAVGGTFEVRSAPGAGTTVTAVLPAVR